MKMSGGWWLFYVSTIYVLAGMINAFVIEFTRLEFIQAAYVIIISLPLWIKPLARRVRISCIWER